MNIGLYPLILGGFAATGLIWSATHSARRMSPSRMRDAQVNTVLNSGIILLAGMLIGARLSYGLFHWSEFASNAWALLDLRAGGLDWISLALGGVIALFFYVGFSNKSPVEILDLNFPLVAVTTIGIWLGAQIAGLGYGPIQTQAWWAIPVLDTSGDLFPRIPYPAMGALFSLLFLILIDRTWQTLKLPKVKLILFCLLEYGMVFGLTYLRADPMARLGSQPYERIAALAHIFVCTIGLVFITINSSSNKRNS